MNKNVLRQEGAISGLAVLSGFLILLVMAFGSVMIWALVNYNDQKTNVDSKVAVAVEEATQAQKETSEAEFNERVKEPYEEFVGPVDLGRLTFSYPKTWSAYIDEEGQTFEAYLHPGVVHPVNSGRPYALRVTIENQPYDRVVKGYESLVGKGDLASSPFTVNGFTGNRLDGQFAKDTEGSMVLFKVRDKTLRVYSEASTFQNDFNEIILPSLSFNP